MLAELHKLPSLFTTTEDNVTLMTTMGASTETLCIYSCTPDGKSHKKELAEAELAVFRESTSVGGRPALTWERLFDEIQISFNNGHVTCKDGVQVAIRLSGDVHVAKFQLAPTTENCQKLIFDGLLFFHFVHSSTKEAERQFEEVVKKEHSLKLSAAELAKEEAMLTDVITRSKEHEATNKLKLAEMTAALAAAGGSSSGGGGGGEGGGDDDTCRFRDPLHGKTCRDFDNELMRLVRSKCEPSDAQAVSASASASPVVRPYTTSELTLQTKNWSTPQRQELWDCLHKLHDWDYDVFRIQTLMTGDDHYSLANQPRGGCLFITCYAILMTHNILQKFKIDEQTLLNFVSVVEAGYHGNAYHNSVHAADVMHITNFILTKGGLIEKCKLTDEDVFAALIAAAIHDFDHPGVNNSFHIRSQTHYAILYNDRSILENRHVSSIFELMKLKHFNVLANLADEQRRDIRDTMIDMVLATDMGLHGKYVAQWKRRIGENHDLHKKDDQRLALAMSLKMADISNCGRPQPLYMRWGAKIADEFYQQGDRERAFGLPCSPFMDRQQPAMARGQISFMNFVVIPMFESISEFLPKMHFSVDHTEANKAYWNQHPDD